MPGGAVVLCYAGRTLPKPLIGLDSESVVIVFVAVRSEYSSAGGFSVPEAAVYEFTLPTVLCD